jgi:integrase
MGTNIGTGMAIKRNLTAQLLNSPLKVGRYYDSGFHGLHLHVRESGSKAWVQRTRLGQKYIDIGFGGYPAVKLADARRIATENKELIEKGIDPRIKAPAPKEVPTFREIAEEEILRVQAQSKNQKHKDQWRSTLERYAYPTLGNLKVDEINIDHIRKALLPIWSTKKETARRVRGRIESVLDVAIVRGLRERYNPAVWRGNLEKLLPKLLHKKTIEHQPALGVEDILKWWSDLKVRHGNGAEALKFMSLTLARSGEVRGMPWDEVEFLDAEKAETYGCKAIWTIPAERMKAGQEHIVPLQNSAVEILNKLNELKKYKLVFPSSRGTQLSDMTLSALMKRIHEAGLKHGKGYLGFKSKRPAVPHGLRSTFRNWASENGYSDLAAEIQLAHTVGNEVIKAYHRTDLFRLRAKMMEDWSKYLESN